MKGFDVSRRTFLRGAGALGAGAGLAGLLAACDQQQGETGAAAGSVTGEPRSGNGEYVEVLMLTSLPYFIDHKLGMDQAGEYLDVRTRFIGPSDLNLNGMISTLEQTVAQDVSGLVVVGFDPALKPAIDKSVDAGIPTVTVDADVSDSKRMCFLGTGNFEAGVLGGQQLAELVGSGAKVMIITRTGQSNLEERVAGYKDVLGQEGVEIVQIANDDSDSAKAASAVEAVLRRVPDLAGIACVEAAGGVGAATALREAGKVGDIKVVSMDRDQETLEAIKDGGIQASIAQKSALMTFNAVLLLHQFQTIEIPITKNNEQAGVTQFPAVVDTGTVIVSEENVDLWMPE